MEKLKPRAIIFDLGSTLIEYEVVPWDELGVLCTANMYKYCNDEGIDIGSEDEFTGKFDRIRSQYRSLATEKSIEWSIPNVVRDLLKQIGIRLDEKLIDQLFDAYYAPVRERLYLYDDTKETLEALREEYPVMGLISNTIFPERAHYEELDRFGIESFFDFKIFSSTFGVRKPHPDIFLHGVNLAGYAPSECVYIGDRYLEDIEGPKSIGMHAILRVKPGRVYPEAMPLADRRIDKLSELKDHIDLKAE